MEAINLNKKGNMIDAYSLRPTLPYDVQGTLVEKDGKNIVVESKIENKNVSYSLKLKEEIQAKLGEKVNVKKENIVGINKEEVKEKKEKSINKEEVIKRLDLEDTDETRKAIEYLVDNDIPVTKENLDSFFMSKEYLEEIVDNMDYDSCIKLIDRDINLKEDSLQKIAESLLEVKGKRENLSLKERLKLDRDLNPKEAEAISKEIYGRKMGKDVYDSIIALHKEDVPITKENIEKVMEVIDKLHDLKDYEDEDFIKALKDDLPFNIETLYKLKHSYENKGLDKNITSPIYEQFTIDKEQSVEDILTLLKELDIEGNTESINLIREFFVNEVEVSKDNYEKIMEMKSNLRELTNILDEKNTTRLLEQGIDPLTEDIDEIIEKLKAQPETVENIKDLDGVKDILKQVEDLKSIKDKDLLQLIKNEEDFKIKNLKELIETDIQLNSGLNEKTAEKAIRISNIFNTLGELDSETISFAVKKYNTISLNTLYDSHVELEKIEEVLIEPIDQAEESFIKQEYLNARSNTTLNIVKESIKDGVELQHIAIDELNNYIDKKVNKYKETQDLINDIKAIKGREEFLIPLIMKNELNMSLGKINDLNTILNSGKGLGNEYNEFAKKQGKYGEEIKEGVQILEKKIKEFSTSLKEGKADSKEEYKDVLKSFGDLNHSFDSQGENRDENLQKIEEYINLQERLSRDDLVLQLPITSGKNYENVNLVIPNIKKGIDKNNMNFHLNMDIENLGQIVFDLKVVGKEVSIEFKGEKEEVILENKDILEDGLRKIGYTLKKLEEKMN